MSPPPFQRFLDEHRSEVMRYLVAAVGRDDADDCFQETFIAALRAYPRLRRDSNPRAWILTIAHRKAIDAHRSRGRGAVPVAAPAELPRAPTGGDPAAATSDDALWKGVRALPPKQRAAVTLRFAADLPHATIAAILDCSEAAARRNLHEGLQQLRREYTP